MVGNRYFGEYFLNLLVLNQDLQDFQDYRGRLRFKRKGARRGLLYMLLFAGALRIGEKLGNKSIVYNNLTTQTGDVICSPENPVNPDSKVAASTKMQTCQEKSKRRIFKILSIREGRLRFGWESVLWGIFPEPISFESGFTGFSGLQRTSSF